MKPVVCFYFLCVLAVWIPLRSTPTLRNDSADAFPGWAAAPIPTGLAPIAPSEREARFAAGFPGKIGVFSDGARIYVVRWVRTSTRKLHPASDCLLALGYSVKPSPIFASTDGSHWGTSSAQHGTERLRVRERIVDLGGREWTDVSAWFWSAAFGHNAGPWWAVTIFEPPEPPAGVKAPL